LKKPPLERGASYEGLSWAELRKYSKTHVIFSNEYISLFSSDTFDFDWDDLFFDHQDKFENDVADAVRWIVENVHDLNQDVICFKYYGMAFIFTQPIEFNNILIKLQTDHNVVELPNFSLHDEIYDWCEG
jgi:hypothetical protein